MRFLAVEFTAIIRALVRSPNPVPPRTMVSNVSCGAYDFQILYPVVVWIFVLVVNVLPAFKLSPDVLLHDVAVLIDFAPAN